jgi:hypothetical protein
MQYFEMPKYDAIKALEIYKRAGQQVQKTLYCSIMLGCVVACLDDLTDSIPHGMISLIPQAEKLSAFYDHCKRLELARTFQFPTLRQVCSVSHPFLCFA